MVSGDFCPGLGIDIAGSSAVPTASRGIAIPPVSRFGFENCANWWLGICRCQKFVAHSTLPAFGWPDVACSKNVTESLNVRYWWAGSRARSWDGRTGAELQPVFESQVVIALPELPGSIVGSYVGPAFAGIDGRALQPGRRGESGLSANADMFPGTHGRQAVLEHRAPKALRLGDLVVRGAFWWVTAVAAAILIAVFVRHRHLRSRHLRIRVRFDLLPTSAFDPSLQSCAGVRASAGTSVTRARVMSSFIPTSRSAGWHHEAGLVDGEGGSSSPSTGRQR
ncbi:hypothetical protein [Amycolatopsis sp. SID8362]|uniref:hypothetical protein n=1 Tax=Amycolatopsis sp. SID8362 TaxID=2690346 RepID=UPI001EF18BD6|nr:hypothetical protein [Amycolatopsis sp. SID8362]